MTFDIDGFLIKSCKANASDIHINCAKSPSLRIGGKIYKISSDIITKNDIDDIIEKTLSQEYTIDLKSLRDLDYIYEIKNVARFRVNYCKDILGGKFTFRVIPYHIKTVDDLLLPPYLKEYSKFNNGIVIVTGATGSGKSTTLASIIELINQTYKKHIVTIEDPVEFIYEDRQSIITQRSLGTDVLDFHEGIKYALRQDPDVILIGEIRDEDTLLSAIEAAETGHLVFSTLHTNGTVSTINRLIGFVEKSNQSDFMKRISACIRGIIHQQLIPTLDGGKLTPALEILTFTPTVADYVKNGKLGEIYPLMQKSRHTSIITLNHSLYELYKEKKISKETAIEYSLEKVEMDQMLRGIVKDNMAKETII